MPRAPKVLSFFANMEGNPMARPRKSADDRMETSIHFAVSYAQRLQAEQLAKNAGLSLSEYARRQVLDGQVVVLQTRKLDRETLYQLRKLGVNLHQLLRQTNTTGTTPPELSSLCSLIEDFVLRQVFEDD
ncbi:MAG: hypothetical protein V7731_01140 [Amphritea sp.]